MARPRGTTSPRPQRVVTREEEETACERLQELKYLWEGDLIPSKELYEARAAQILREGAASFHWARDARGGHWDRGAKLNELKYLWEEHLIPSKELYVERAAEILAESDPTSGHHNASETPQSESFFSRFSSASVAASVAAVVAAAAGASWWAWT